MTLMMALKALTAVTAIRMKAKPIWGRHNNDSNVGHDDDGDGDGDDDGDDDEDDDGDDDEDDDGDDDDDIDQRMTTLQPC